MVVDDYANNNSQEGDAQRCDARRVGFPGLRRRFDTSTRTFAKESVLLPDQ